MQETSTTAFDIDVAIQYSLVVAQTFDSFTPSSHHLCKVAINLVTFIFVCALHGLVIKYVDNIVTLKQ